MQTECKFDEGGYFILNGNEKVVMTVECPVYNKLLFTKRDDKYECFLYSQKTDISKVVSFHIYYDLNTSLLTLYSRTLMKEPISLFSFLKCMDYFETNRSLYDNILNLNKKKIPF